MPTFYNKPSFEYKFWHAADHEDHKELPQKFNEWGEEGWEFVSASRIEGTPITEYIFKRLTYTQSWV